MTGSVLLAHLAQRFDVDPLGGGRSLSEPLTQHQPALISNARRAEFTQLGLTAEVPSSS
jgi:hypothetical protein